MCITLMCITMCSQKITFSLNCNFISIVIIICSSIIFLFVCNFRNVRNYNCYVIVLIACNREIRGNICNLASLERSGKFEEVSTII